jgi:hypothetical protein
MLLANDQASNSKQIKMLKAEMNKTCIPLVSIIEIWFFWICLVLGASGTAAKRWSLVLSLRRGES